VAKFGKVSLANLEGVHADLVRLHTEAIKHVDYSITDGIRTLAEQVKNLARGASTTMNSKHLPQTDGLSHATDVAPYPAPDWDAVDRGLAALRQADPGFETVRFYELKGFLRGMAAALGIDVRVGEDWDNDWQFNDHKFIDLPHIELVDPG
jgi:peptidoglycan L-alanyl-D-glutamate endopeptidase CwlK